MANSYPQKDLCLRNFGQLLLRMGAIPSSPHLPTHGLTGGDDAIVAGLRLNMKL